jgi:hypothetical protein
MNSVRKCTELLEPDVGTLESHRYCPLFQNEQGKNNALFLISIFVSNFLANENIFMLFSVSWS